MAEHYLPNLREARLESEKFQAAFNRNFPGCALRIDELTFAIDLGKKSFMCRCPMSNGVDEEFYEVRIVVHEPRQVKTLILKFHTTNEIFDLFHQMVGA